MHTEVAKQTSLPFYRRPRNQLLFLIALGLVTFLTHQGLEAWRIRSERIRQENQFLFSDRYVFFGSAEELDSKWWKKAYARADRECAQITDYHLDPHEVERQISILKTRPNITHVNTFDICDDGTLQLISGLDHLQSLSLGGAKITDVGTAHLRKLSRLRSLSFSECENVTDSSLDTLKALPELEFLALTETGITHAGVARFRSERPNVGVNFFERRRKDGD